MASWVRAVCWRDPLQECLKQAAAKHCIPLCEPIGVVCAESRCLQNNYQAPESNHGHRLQRSDLVPVTSPALIQPSKSGLRMVAISDTHEFHAQLVLPPADVLLHCGDLLTLDRFSPHRLSMSNFSHFLSWIEKQPTAVKFFVGGNHDLLLERLGKNKIRKLCGRTTVYVENEVVSVTVIDEDGQQSFTFVGSPAYSVPHGSKPSSNEAFATALPKLHQIFDNSAVTGTKVILYRSGKHKNTVLTEIFYDVPITRDQFTKNIDVLFTHGHWNSKPIRDLIEKINPALHLGGHLHGAHGTYPRPLKTATVCLNVSSCRGLPFQEWLMAPVCFELCGKLQKPTLPVPPPRPQHPLEITLEVSSAPQGTSAALKMFRLLMLLLLPSALAYWAAKKWFLA